MAERSVGFCERHPLFGAAVYCAAVMAAACWSPWAALGAALALAAAVAFSTGSRVALGWLACGALAFGVATSRENARENAGKRLVAEDYGMATARLTEDARASGRYWTAPARLIDGPEPGALVWWEGTGEAPVAGARVRGRGRFSPLPAMRNPGEFDRGGWLRRQGIAAVFEGAGMPGGVETPWLAALAAEIRHGFRERTVTGLPPRSRAADVIRAVVVGEKPENGDELIESFRHSGTLHVFTVSGLHVALVALIGWLALSWAGLPRRRAVILLLPLVSGYAWITGNEAPAVRSAWMTAVFLGAFVWRRRPDLLNSLGAVLLAALLWDGRLLFLPGVQLSYGVVAAIALAAGPASRGFAWLACRDTYLPVDLMSRWQRAWWTIRQRLAQSLGVSLAAAIGSTPLTAWHFGLVTPVSIIAGVCILPLVFGMLALALLSVALSPIIPQASIGLNRLNGHMAEAVAGIAETGASIPGGHFRLRGDSTPVLRIYDLDHGAGAACFAGGNGGNVLIDCGDRRGFEYRLLPSLRRLGTEPDSVVITHPDGAHAGGGATVWDALPIRQALLPASRSRSPAIRAWLDAAPRSGVTVLQTADHRHLPFPDRASLEILHAPDPLAVSTAADDRVAILRLHWRGWKILFTSDAGLGTELKLLDSGQDLSADVIVAGKHLHDISLGDAFLTAVRPRAMVLTNPPFPPEQRRSSSDIDYWKSLGIRIFDQRETGAVIVRAGDKELRMEEFVTGKTATFTRP